MDGARWEPEELPLIENPSFVEEDEQVVGRTGTVVIEAVELLTTSLAHKLDLTNGEYRSEDVIVDGEDKDVDFREFGLSDEVIRGLVHEGFEKPSPIQLGAIPIGLTGHDMLMQSKSGTGKTCVFSVIVLERTLVSEQKIQALVLCPSREIAVQTQYVLQSIGAFKEGLQVGLFIGGCPLAEDARRISTCHIAVGTPGRLVHLLNDFGLDLTSVKVFVIDEADKVFEDSFAADVGVIRGSIPSTAQVLLVSATFEDGIEQHITDLGILKDPVKVQLDVGGPALLGVVQYGMDVRKTYNFVPEEGQPVKFEEMTQLKLRAIMDLLGMIPYGQAIIFSEFQLKAERIHDELRAENVDAVLLSGAQAQSLRLDSFRKFQKEKVPILVATDLGARGLDYEHVNLVINYECPSDLATYIHRMGRSGRFGSFGRVVTLLGYGNDMTNLTRFQHKVNLNISLVQNLEDIESIASAPSSPDEVTWKANKKKFIPIKMPSGQPLLTFGEAMDFLENGGKEAADFATVYCTRSKFSEENIDPDHFRKMFDEFMLANCSS